MRRVGLLALVVLGCQSPAPPPLAAPEPSAEPTPPKQLVRANVLQPGLPHHTIILTYHDMVPKRDRNALWFDCTPDELRAQIRQMRAAGATFLPLTKAVDRMTGAERIPLDSPTICITFADNYAGFLKHAWPILKEENIPVTLFVHTGHVGSQKGRPKMTWDQLKELQASGLVWVESQTISHAPDLAKLTDAQLKKEMEISRASIEKHLGRDPEFVAYPNGKYNERAMAAAQAAGYRAGFSEKQMPAEASPGIYEIARYVHTELDQALEEIER